MQLSAALGLRVLFLPDDLRRTEPYASMLENSGIEILTGEDWKQDWASKLREESKSLDYVWLSGPLVAVKYLDLLLRHSSAKILYYLHDLHYLREAAQYLITKEPSLLIRARAFRWLEHSIIEDCDAAISLGENEIEHLSQTFSPSKLCWMPAYVSQQERTAAASERRDVVFVGSFKHKPNVDAVRWFSSELWPRIAARLPEASFHIIGSNAPDWVRALRSDRVKIHDSISDQQLGDVYRQCRVAVVPLRFGAGAKIKVLEAMDHGTAVVATQFGVEGLPHAATLPPAVDNPVDFVNAVVRCCRDEAHWSATVQCQAEYLRRFFTLDVATLQLRRALFDDTALKT